MVRDAALLDRSAQHAASRFGICILGPADAEFHFGRVEMPAIRCESKTLRIRSGLFTGNSAI